MINPLCFIVGMFIAGIISIKYGLVFYASPIILIAYQFIYYKESNQKLKKSLKSIFIISIISILAFILGMNKGVLINKPSFIQKHMIENERIVSGINGTVMDVIDRQGGIKLLVKVNTIDDIPVSGNEMVYVYTDKSYNINSVIYFKSQMFFYEKPGNPGEFDNYSYNATRYIYAYSFPDEIIIKNSGGWSVKRLIVSLRRWYINKLCVLFNEDNAGLLILMLTGNSSFMDKELREVYQSAGFAHILSISGLHISIIGLSLYNLLRKKKVGYIPSTIFTIIFLLFYYQFSGGHVTCLRAIFSILFALTGRALAKRSDGLTAISLAAFIILIKSPGYIYDVSFLLSFMAGLGIVLLNRPISILEILYLKAKLNKSLYFKTMGLIKSVLFSVSINIILLPVQMLFFYSFTPYGFIVNVLLLPLLPIVLVGAIIIPLFAGLHIIVNNITKPVTIILALFKNVCGLISSVSNAKLITGTITLFKLSIWLTGVMIFIIMTRKKQSINYKHFIPLIATLIISIPIHNNSLSVNYLYVGQGDCCVITKGDYVAMIDCGSSDNDRMYENIVIPYLNYYGYSEIDTVFLSHADKDHVSGVIRMCEKDEAMNSTLVLPRLESYGEYNKIFNDDYFIYNFNHVEYVGAGDKIHNEDISFNIIYPNDDNNRMSENNTSMVIVLDYYDKKFLFMGDLGTDYEEQVIEGLISYDFTNIDVLKVGHHGSRFSTGLELLAVAKPKVSILSSGKGNAYGHPHAETLERLDSIGSENFRTDNNGAIRIEVNEGIKILAYKTE